MQPYDVLHGAAEGDEGALLVGLHPDNPCAEERRELPYVNVNVNLEKKFLV